MIGVVIVVCVTAWMCVATVCGTVKDVERIRHDKEGS